MTNEEIAATAKRYAERFVKLYVDFEVQPAQAPTDEKCYLLSLKVMQAHFLWMCAAAEEYALTGRRDEALLVLGFIRGWLWATSSATIQGLNEAPKPSPSWTWMRTYDNVGHLSSNPNPSLTFGTACGVSCSRAGNLYPVDATTRICERCKAFSVWVLPPKAYSMQPGWSWGFAPIGLHRNHLFHENDAGNYMRWALCGEHYTYTQEGDLQSPDCAKCTARFLSM